MPDSEQDNTNQNISNTSPSSTGTGAVKGEIMLDITHAESLSPKTRREIRARVLSPSEWIRLIAREWLLSLSQEQGQADGVSICSEMDTKFQKYKPFLSGKMSAPLLCRIGLKDSFWTTLGIVDEFDRSYIMSQVERFREMYGIAMNINEIGPRDDVKSNSPIAYQSFGKQQQEPTRSGQVQNVNETSPHGSDASVTKASAAFQPLLRPYPHVHVQQHMAPYNQLPPPPYSPGMHVQPSLAPYSNSIVSHQQQPLMPYYGGYHETYEPKHGRTPHQADYNAAYASYQPKRRKRDNSASPETHLYDYSDRGEVKKRMLSHDVRDSREVKKMVSQQKKEEAFSRVQALLQSDHLPVETNRSDSSSPDSHQTGKQSSKKVKSRSCIVVSTAKDLNTIVTQSNMLFQKYTTAVKRKKGGKERVTWQQVAREIGIGVKVREKYARWHARAKVRGI